MIRFLTLGWTGSVVSLALFVTLAGTSHAALMVTDGTFSTPTVGSTNQDVGNWYDANAVNFDAYIIHSNSTFTGSPGQMLGLTNTAAFAYQSLGTLSAGEDVLTVTLDAHQRGGGSTSRDFSTLTIDFYAGAFGAAADGTDIDGTLSSFDQLTLSAGDLGFPSSGSASSLVVSVGSIDLTGQTIGTEIWMRLSTSDAVPGTSASFVDNVNIDLSAIPPMVPEPNAIALGLVGLVSLSLGMWRRRRRA